MTNILLMEIFYSVNDACNYELSVFLRKLTSWLAFKERPKGNSRDVLHDDVDMIVGLESIVDFEDVVVIDALKDFDLSSH